MAQLILRFILLLPSILSAINMGWIDYTLSSGIYCSSSTNICCHIAHFVFWIQPNDPLTNYIGGGYISLDNKSWQSSSKIDFEQHYFSFNDSMRVQVYNFMFESFFTWDMIHTFNTSSINVKLFVTDNSSPHQITFLQLPQPLTLNEINLSVPPNAKESSYYDHGNSTIECNVQKNKCRLVVHVVFKYAPVGDFAFNYNYIGNGELYINNDTKPTNLTNNMGVTWERAIVFKNDTYFHGSNWGFDHIGDYEYLSKSIQRVCWKVFVMDLQGTNVHYIPMNGGYGGYQISKYIRCFEPALYFWN